MTKDDGERRTHELKIWPVYFEPLIDGRRSFEVRRNDRGFKEGDALHLREWAPEGFTGREVRRRIIYLTEYGTAGGFEAMDLRPFVVLGLVEDPTPSENTDGR